MRSRKGADVSALIDEVARRIPAEERPVGASHWAGFGAFLGIYGGEHIAATEFVIGALLVAWGVPARELLFGLFVGNLLAASSYALVTAPIAVDTRLTLFAYLRKIMGPWFQRAYNAVWGCVSIVWAASMMAIATTSLKAAFGLPVQLHWYPTSVQCVMLTLSLTFVTVIVSAYGFSSVVRFSSLCVPWMAVMFFCGAAIAVSMLVHTSGVGTDGGIGGFVRILETEVFSGRVQDGGAALSWLHVAAFAWVCGFVYHVGLNDMSIFRFARKSSYGWVGLFGMYFGHFFAWICAGVMGAAAADVLKVGLGELDSGAVAQAVLGVSGLLAVVVAGWTTATPNIYRAALSFATFFPRASFARLALGVGAVIGAIACFPGVMRIDMIATGAAILVPSVGAICLVEHWLFPRLSLVRHWNLYRGGRVNVPGLIAWGVSACFAIVCASLSLMHPFFLPIPTFVVAGASYLILAPMMGARERVSAERKAYVDAVETRIATLGEALDDKPLASRQDAGSRGACCCFWVLSLSFLTGLVVMSLTCPDSFERYSPVVTAGYFVTGIFASLAKRKVKK